MLEHEVNFDILGKRLLALSCRTRREILNITKSTPLTARVISKTLGITQVTVKRHIRTLIDYNLLVKYRRGNGYVYQTDLHEFRELVGELYNMLN